MRKLFTVTTCRSSVQSAIIDSRTRWFHLQKKREILSREACWGTRPMMISTGGLRRKSWVSKIFNQSSDQGSNSDLKDRTLYKMDLVQRGQTFWSNSNNIIMFQVQCLCVTSVARHLQGTGAGETFYHHSWLDFIWLQLQLRCLDQHYMTHLATKQLPCPLCGKTFGRKSFLAKHVAACGGVKQEVDVWTWKTRIFF